MASRVLAAPKGAHTVERPAAKGKVLKRSGRTLRDKDLTVLGRTLAQRLADADPDFSHLPPDDGESVLAAVDALFAAPVTMDDVQATHLDPTRLRHTLSARAAAVPTLPTRSARDAFDTLVDACCAHVVEFFSRQGEFATRTILEIARTTGAILDRLPATEDERDAAFRARYARGVRPGLDKARLYGVGELTAEESVYALTTSYVDLPLHGTGAGARPQAGSRREPAPARSEHVDFGIFPDTEPPPDARAMFLLGAVDGDAAPEHRVLYVRAPGRGTSIDDVLSRRNRLVLEGAAGSGKTTLLRRLAVRCLDDDHPWGGERTPFLVKLRSLVHDGRLVLPVVEEFTTATGSTLAGEQPEGWVSRRLREGSATVLIDGVDELPPEHRARALDWVEQLGVDYPNATYVLTSRPDTLSQHRLTRLTEDAGYALAHLRPMTPGQVHECVRRWHRTHARRGGDATELDATAEALVAILESRHDLARLATSPLLCALVCALHRNSDGILPKGRTALYRSALAMMLGGRERARGITASRVRLHPDQAERLLAALAHWMTLEGRRSIPHDVAHTLVETRRPWLTPPHTGDPYTTDELLEHLLRRSGVLHEPEAGVVEFVHASFQDYLSAAEMIEGRHIGHLLAHAQDPLYHDVIVMAAARAQTPPRVQSELLRGLLSAGERHESGHPWMLAGAAITDAAMVDPEVRAAVLERTRSLLPPAGYDQTREIVAMGDFAMDLLIDHLDAAGDAVDPLLLTAILGGALTEAGDDAIPLLRRTRRHPSPVVRTVVATAVNSVLDTDRYIDDVLLTMQTDDIDLHVDDVTLLGRRPDLGVLATSTCVTDWNEPTTTFLSALPRLRALTVRNLWTWPGATQGVLWGLRRLRRLRLEACDLGGDLRTVAELTDLEALELYDCSGPADLEILTALPRLTHLDIRHSSIHDPQPLAGMTSLRFLRLELGPDDDAFVDRLRAGAGQVTFERECLVWRASNP
ncbi:NACHT domain-containing protein [Embleya sp. NPDC005971]|uniref:NACHT domain-containing protein n=1 Tax=Embleya sp. NPDC005971 TaxID=3156724 RepID=UPI0033C3C7FA